MKKASLTDIRWIDRVWATRSAGTAELRRRLNEWWRQIEKELGENTIRWGQAVTPLEKAELNVRFADWVVDWSKAQNTGQAIMQPAMLEIIRKAGQRTVKMAQLSAAFDVTDPNVIAIAKNQSAQLITNLTKETRKTVRKATKEAIEQGRGTRYLAQSLPKQIGLNNRQKQWVSNYRARLQAEGVAGRQLQDKVDKYIRKHRRYRANMIARTESSYSYAQGSLESYKQNNVKELSFLAAPSACSVCLGLNGGKYKVSEARGVIPVHPHCRCTWISA